jgi:hypothetical protein
MFGEAGHPLSTEVSRQVKVDPANIQVWYKKLWMEDNLVKAVFTGTSNELGKAFNLDLKRGQRPSFSLRALGSVVNEGGALKVARLSLICYDRVIYPSHSCAYTTGIVKESANVKINASDIIDTSMTKNQIDKLTEAGNCLDGSPLVVPLTQEEVSNYLVQESGNIQSAISTFDVLYESIQLNPNLDTVTMKTRIGDTFRICLEDAVKREIVHGISRYF